MTEAGKMKSYKERCVFNTNFSGKIRLYKYFAVFPTQYE